MMVVDVEPACKSTGPVGLSAVGPDVGPLLHHGPVEALHFSIGLGPVGAAVAVLDGPQGLVEEGSPVAKGVVGEHPLDHDALGGEPGLGPAPEGGCRPSLLVGQDLGVGQARVVVDGGVQVGVPDPDPSVFAGALASVDPMATPGWDLAQFLHVDVDQLTRAFPLVAADPTTGGPVEVLQAGALVANQDPVDGGGGDLEAEGDPVRASLLGPPETQDPLLCPTLDSGGRALRAAGAVGQPGFAELLVAGPPLVGALARNAHLGGHMGDGASCLDALAE